MRDVAHRRPDAVQQQVHRAQPGRAVDELDAVHEVVAQVVALGRGQMLGVAATTYSCAASRKPPVPQAGSTTVSSGCGLRRQSTIAWMSGAGREVLARAGLHVLGALLAAAPRRRRP